MEVILPDIVPPQISWVSIDAGAENAAIIISTSEGNGTIFYAVSLSPLTKAQIIEFGETISVTFPGAQAAVSVEGLTEDTDYYFQCFHRDLIGNELEDIHTEQFTTADVDVVDFIIVYNNAQWQAAIDAGVETLIKVAPGEYTQKNLVAGKNRTANPLVMTALDINNKPILIDASQSMVNTEWVTWNGFHCKKVDGFSDGYYFWDALSSSSTGSGCRYCKWFNIIFEGTDPGNKTNPIPNPTYNVGMVRAFGLVNYNTHTYTVSNIVLKFMNTFGDFRFNGTNLIRDIYCEFWYFDGMRYYGQPDAGRVHGFTKIVNYNMLNCLAVYEEIDNVDSPHPDHSQGINVGGTNPILVGQRVDNLLWCRIVNNPGPYRGCTVQNGLAQTPINNSGHVQCLYLTKANPQKPETGSPHGLSFEAGANEVLVQNCTLAGFLGYESPWIRYFKSTGTVMVRDSIFRAFNTAATGTNANRAGFALVNVNNKVGYVYNDTFNGPLGKEGVEGAMVAYTPKQDFNGQGALTTSGQFRDLVHAPMGPIEAPALTGNSGNFQVDELPEPHPDFMSDNNAALGGTDYTRVDLRYCIADTRNWSAPQLDVEVGDIFSVSAGVYWVQHRYCIGTGPTLQEGLWSNPHAVVTVT
jgi:hypothetical protein